MALSTRASNGMPPMFLNHATRTPLKLRSRLPAKRDPGWSMEIGQRGSGPAMALSSNTTSETVRAIGPCTEMVSQTFPWARCGTRLGAVRIPTTLQNAVGFRSDPLPALRFDRVGDALQLVVDQTCQRGGV